MGQPQEMAIRNQVIVTNDIIIHQDADLEYDPSDYQLLLNPILNDSADIVFGSRFKGEIQKMKNLNQIGNRAMTKLCRWLYGINISDLMTCYKIYRTSLIKNLKIKADGFDFEAEFTARLAQQAARFSEVPISFIGRSFEEGKKIRAADAVHVIRKLLNCKFTKVYKKKCKSRNIKSVESFWLPEKEPEYIHFPMNLPSRCCLSVTGL